VVEWLGVQQALHPEQCSCTAALTNPRVSASLQKGKRKKDSLSVNPVSTPPSKLETDLERVVGVLLLASVQKDF